jgi:hypothetical protein
MERTVSADVYRWVVEAVAGAPPWVDAVLEVAGESAALVVLGVLLVWVGLGAVRRAVVVGVGTAVAYAVSEGVNFSALKGPGVLARSRGALIASGARLAAAWSPASGTSVCWFWGD